LGVGIPLLAALLGAVFLLLRERNVIGKLHGEVAGQQMERHRLEGLMAEQKNLATRQEVDGTQEVRELPHRY